MNARILLALLVLAAVAAVPRAAAQIYTPQSATGVSVSFQTERMGGSRVLVFGDVRNSTGQTYERVVLLAEGLDAAGQVVSRARTYVSGTLNPNSSTSFELRLLSAGAERRYRVTVESFQQVQN
jgi:hypothetical protein